MTDKKPAVIETTIIAWVDGIRAVSAMPVVVGIAFVLILAMTLPGLAIGPNVLGLAFSPWLPVISIVSSIVQAALLAPLAIAVHRFVLLGERANRYPLEPGSNRYLRFVGFVILFKILWSIPNMIRSLALVFPLQLLSIVSSILLIAVIIVMVRRAILFPGIAIDAPGATWSNAQLDTKGSSWRVAFIILLTELPVMIIEGLLYWLFYWPLLMSQAQPSTSSFLFFTLVATAVYVLGLCAFAAAASHIYQVRADAMTRASG